MLLLRSLAKLPLTPLAEEQGLGGQEIFSLFYVNSTMGLGGLGVVACVEERRREMEALLLIRVLTFLKSFKTGGITLSRDVSIQLMAIEEEIYHDHAD